MLEMLCFHCDIYDGKIDTIKETNSSIHLRAMSPFRLMSETRVPAKLQLTISYFYKATSKLFPTTHYSGLLLLCGRPLWNKHMQRDEFSDRACHS